MEAAGDPRGRHHNAHEPPGADHQLPADHTGPPEVQGLDSDALRDTNTRIRLGSKTAFLS